MASKSAASTAAAGWLVDPAEAVLPDEVEPDEVEPDEAEPDELVDAPPAVAEEEAVPEPAEPDALPEASPVLVEAVSQAASRRMAAPKPSRFFKTGR